MNIGMSILVRDEADIIEENIRYHANQGVCQFVVTDNGSVDGTRDILNSLSHEFPLTVFDETRQTIDQDLWVTRMAYWLRDSTNVEWVINNDADEFWIPDTGTLNDALKTELEALPKSQANAGVLHCKRFNYLPAEAAIVEPGYRFLHNHLRVLKTPEYGPLSSSDNVLITDQGTKVICRLSGLEAVAMGNHDALHDGTSCISSRISVAHYPLRTYTQFEKKVHNHGSSIARNKRFGADINWHLRRWFEQLKNGDLLGEYQNYVIREEQQRMLEEDGVICVDEKVEQLIVGKI